MTSSAPTSTRDTHSDWKDFRARDAGEFGQVPDTRMAVLAFAQRFGPVQYHPGAAAMSLGVSAVRPMASAQGWNRVGRSEAAAA